MNDYYRLRIKKDTAGGLQQTVTSPSYAFVFSDDINDWIQGTNTKIRSNYRKRRANKE